MHATLVVGNRNYSSWSLRGWLALRKSGAEFETVRLALDTPTFAEEIRRYSPAGLVPVLRHGEHTIWDSLAIAEYANEVFANGALWPANPQTRGWARSVSAEMHSGFFKVRGAMPMNCRATGRRVENTAELQTEVDRIQAIWDECRTAFANDGPWLFGRFSIADAMYAPVVSRFITYGVALTPAARDYADAVLADPDMSEWMAAGREESEVLEREEVGHTGGEAV
ncbi:MAG: glutathione S-transferase family protein [Ectothiorhodospiraceae bacterium]|jgi:glutathione S-transferase